MSFNKNFRYGPSNEPTKEDELNRRTYFVEKLISNAFERNRPSSTPIITNADIYVEPQQAFKVWDSQERGELIYAEVAVNSALIIPEIILYDDLQQPITLINNMTFLQLLKLGRGMTPGSVQASATGQTQDDKSIFIPNMFHIARYKDDTLADWTSNNGSDTASDRWYVGRFVATVPFPYSAISFYIKNTTTDLEPKRIFSYSLARTVYEYGARIPTIENPQPVAVEVSNVAEIEEQEVELTEELPNVVYEGPTG